MKTTTLTLRPGETHTHFMPDTTAFAPSAVASRVAVVAKPAGAVAPEPGGLRRRASWVLRLLLLASLGWVSACSLAPARRPRPPILKATGGLPPMTDARPRDVVSVPMVYDPEHTVPVVTARLNGGPGFPLVLDSGGNHTIIGKHRADRARLPSLGATGQITTAFGNREKTELALVRELQLGRLTLHDVPVLVHGFSQSKLTEMLGGELNVLGTPALSAFAFVSFDYRRQRVHFSYDQRYSTPSRREGAFRLPLSFTADGHLRVPITFPGGRTRQAIVDTGYDGVLLISPETLDSLGLSHHAATGRPVRAVGPGAELSGRVFLLPGLRMDGQDLPEVEAWTGKIAEPLLIGSGLLRYFKATFDFERMVLWLERP